ncbi:MAG: hypothetical protein WC998_06125 [Candidatus Paceibacterota bacterium]|jgi:hypothetical protein
MSGETWGVTKTDWVVGEAIPTTWPNKLEGNISVLGRGNGRSALETAVVASNLVLPNETDETFYLSGNGGIITYIDHTNRQPGNRIQLIKTNGAASISPNGASAPDGFKPIIIYNSGLLYPGMQSTNLDIPEGMLITFVFTGDNWHCTV